MAEFLAKQETSGSWNKEALIDWLLTEGPRTESIAALMDLFCRRLVGYGVPLWRGSLHLRTLHPLVWGWSYVWWRDRDGFREVVHAHGGEETEEYRNSPLRGIFDDGVDGLRYRIDQLPPPHPYPILTEFQAQGATDYVAMPIRFSSGHNNVVSFASDRPGGFDPATLGLLYDVLPALTAIIEAKSLRRLVVNILDTYVGRDAGLRVLSGDIRRGTAVTMGAVLWYCDLRGFTNLADRLPLDELIGLLNGYFECMALPVQARGGDILKFIGDAMLAVFPLGDRDPAAVCDMALEAAEEALKGMAELNAERAAWGQPILKAGIALHLGDVMYGNIGAPSRLDFTVIGPAVNLVTRIEGLCSRLDRVVLSSAVFGRTVSGGRLLSLGWQPVRGLKEPVEVFGMEPA
ncbi:MAG: adenylate/guanylate cyclase domain-containing protein [Azospirillaceae bacterium]|nr:adenylate/guanylate cyclase domain-containing protein [Azospirillaceae bacterium]